MKKLTFENFEKITPKKPLVVEVGDNNNFYIKITLTPHTFLYCIDMFYDKKLKTESNRIFTKDEIYGFGTILIEINRFINIVKVKNKNGNE